MNLFRNMIAVILGLVVGSGVNMLIIILGPELIPPPSGFDNSSMASYAASAHLLEPRHFVTPFFAHAIGTLAGSLTAFIVAASYKHIICYAVAGAFFLGGIVASVMIPAPWWFVVLDLIAAYIPMAALAVVIVGKSSQQALVSVE